jgi:hypothetical protein
MIHLTIEDYGDGGIMRLDEAAQAFLGAGLNDALLFDSGHVTVQLASGEMGGTFNFSIIKAAPG